MALPRETSVERNTVARPELTRSPISAAAGIGLRPSHMPEIAAHGAPLAGAAWFEIHSENFLSDGGPRRAMLDAIRQHTPISCHGVGLSLGSHAGLDPDHLTRLKTLFDWVQPGLISEHLSWSVIDGTYLNDLLPLPYTGESLNVVAVNVDRAQQTFGRQILIENPSSYLTFPSSEMPEWEFLARLVDRTQCGLLLDVNNIYVSGENNGLDVAAYFAGIPAGAVGEIHLAGHVAEGQDDERILIDTHSQKICDDVWSLFESALRITGPVPVLIEWDLDLPSLAVLLEEADTAQRMIDRHKLQSRSHVA